MSASLADRYFVVLLGVLVLVLNMVWLVLDEQPLVWDAAYHQIRGWECLKIMRAGRLLENFASVSSYYPPLFYLQEAVVLFFWQDRDALSFLSNLPGMAMLFGGTWWLGARSLKVAAAPWAAILTLLFPLVAWTSRLSLLDLALSGWVTVALCLVVKIWQQKGRGSSLLLGLVFAAGLLTKWTFALFLVAPLIWVVLNSSDRRRAVLHLVDAGLVATPLVFWWYLPNAQSLMERFALTVQAAQWEHDPRFGSLLWWLYYPRSLASYYLFLPLTGLFFVGMVRGWYRDREQSPVGNLIWWTFLGGLFLLTLVEAKDPRYVMPLAGPMAILIFLPWQRQRLVACLVVSLAFLQVLVLSLPFPLVPQKLALFEVVEDKEYKGLGREWVFFASHYFDVAGPPQRENWRQGEILAHIPQGARVGFVPDLAHFHAQTLELHSLEAGRQLDIIRLGQSVQSLEQLEGLQAIVGKTGNQGIPSLTSFNTAVYDAMVKGRWQLDQKWSLPDGEEAFLWLR